LWTAAPAGHVTSDGEIHEVKFAAYDNEVKSKSNTTTKLFIHPQTYLFIKSLKNFLMAVGAVLFSYDRHHIYKIISTL